MRNLTCIFSATALLCSCSNETKKELISDPLIKSAYESLELEYIEKVKPENASYIKCSYAFIDNRHIAQCGISFRTSELSQKGLWEIENSNGSVTVYAMNGKALRALESMTKNAQFKSGAGRTAINHEKVNELFK